MSRRSNPMPTMGALFITNPRRKNPMATRRRRNGLALRRNALALRRNGQKEKMVMHELGISRAKAKALKKANYKRYTAAYNKAVGATTLSELVGSGKARRAGWKARVFAISDSSSSVGATSFGSFLASCVENRAETDR